MCDVLYVVCLCVFCGFVCRVLRNGAIVSKTVCKHFEKTVNYNVIAINMQLGLQKHYINFSLKKLYS